MLKRVDLTYGADPELFLQQDGRIIGSERVIPEEGLRKVVVRDGVQVELNPQPGTSPNALGVNISNAFRLLARRLQEVNNVTCCFDVLVDVPRSELDALSQKARELGCQPSKNAYGEKPITVDVKEYRKRGAAGHMHLGLLTVPEVFSPRSNIDARATLIPLLDVFVANTAVLLDRDPGNAERRQNYGRAGEYRDDKPYGLEYRTPSNFWLRNYTLLDLMYGMAAFATSVLYTTQTGQDLEQELADIVKIDSFVEAIETNNFSLAWQNFREIVPFIRKYSGPAFPLHTNNIELFLSFAQAVESNGLTVFFPEPTVEHWVRGTQIGFDRFLTKYRS